MARTKKVEEMEEKDKPKETSENVQNDVSEEIEVPEEPKKIVYHPSEKEVETNGKLYLEWTNEKGCTFKMPKPL